MNPAKRGLAAAGKVGIVVVIVVLVLGGVYLAPSMLSTGSSRSTTATSSSQSAQASSSTVAGGQGTALLSLFGYFSQMQLQTSAYDNNEAFPLAEQHDYSYLVLGKGTINSTQYTKVEFSQAVTNSDVVAWFNPQGGVDRVDVVGVRNYTGPTAYVYTQLYVSAFSVITGLSNNATLLSILKQTSQNTTSFGPTQLPVTTYSLATPTAPFASATLALATIPGTTAKIAVYFDEKTTDGLETTYQVMSLTK
jgi:hypothetical protein